MGKNCYECGATRFRISRLRISDVPRLFILRYPVRCVSCHTRTYASISGIMAYKRKRARQKHADSDAKHV